MIRAIVLSLLAGLLGPANLLRAADGPGVPGELAIVAVRSNSLVLDWTAPGGNSGVAGYRVYRNGAALGTSTRTSYTDTGLAPNTTNHYEVRAFDAAGHLSAPSAPVTGVTPKPEGYANPKIRFRHFTIQDPLPGTAWGTAGIPLADFDGDGDLDCALSRRDAHGFWWYERRTDAVWVQHVISLSTNLAQGLGCAALDIDGDQWIDLVFDGVWFQNPGTLKQNPDAPWPAHSFAGAGHDILAADIDQDGRKDIVVFDGKSLRWFNPVLSMASNTIVQNLQHHGGLTPNGVGDLDGDGDPDLVVAGAWFENPGKGLSNWVRHPWPHLVIPNASYGTSIRSWVVDLDKDGDLDIVYSDCDTGSSHVYWVRHDGKGTNWTRIPLPDPPTSPGSVPGTGSFHSLAVADFDLDGDLDVFAGEQEDPDKLGGGRLPMKPPGLKERGVVWLNSGSKPPVFTPCVIQEDNPGWHDVCLGDVDGDGDLDLVSKVWNKDGVAYHADYWRNDTILRPNQASRPDTEAPGVPSQVAVANTASTTVSLRWAAAKDDAGVAGYRIYRNGAEAGTSTTTSFTDHGLAPAKNYRYTVRAFDAAANQSSPSTPVRATTTARGDGGVPRQGLAFWVRADAGVTLQGGAVTQWADQSGNHRDAVQESAASQPTLVTNQLNGKPVLRFDGVDDFLKFNLPINGSTGLTLVLVAANRASRDPGPNQGHCAALFWDETASWGWTYLSPFQSNIVMRFGTTQSGNLFKYPRPASAGTHFSITLGLHEGATDSLYVDGNRVLTAAGKQPALAAAVATPWLGRGAGNTFFPGDLAEVLVYTRALAEPERVDLEDYLRGRYGATPFALQTLDTTVRGPWLKTVGDLNGDGRIDLVAGGAEGGGLVAYLNDYPKWRREQVDATGTFSTDGEVADVDGDGRKDLLAITLKPAGVVWYRNTPGGWQPQPIFTNTWHDLEVADLDGDARPDVVGRNQKEWPAGNDAGNLLYVGWQRRTGSTITWELTTLPCPPGEGLLLTDIDRDGDQDLVVNQRWYENLGHRRWAEHEYASAATWRHPNTFIAAADINGDGRRDLILAPSEREGHRYQVSWFEAPGNPRAGPWPAHTIATNVETVLHFVGAADFDGDGRLDLVTAQMSQGADPDAITLYLNRGSRQAGTWVNAWSSRMIAEDGSHSMRIVDADGDGRPDLFGANWRANQRDEHVKLWLNRFGSGLALQ